MSKKDEAMKLALEALVRSRKAVSGDLDLAGCAYGKNDSDGHRYADAKTALVTLDKAITALREALAEQPAQQDSACSNALRAQGKAYPRTCKKCGLGPCVELAQQALDKMAKNARDIGLDYEPSSGTQVSKVWRDGGKLVAKQVPLEDFYKPAQHRAWFTVDELSAWADKKLKENPQWAEQPAQQEPVRVPVTDNTYNYAKSLAEAIFKQHFASDEHYSSGRIVWGVNDTVIGILTQIDNMVADMVRKPAQQEPVAHVMFRQDKDGLEPVMFYGPGTAPDPATLKDRFVLKDVWLSPPPQREWVDLTVEEIQDCCATTLTPFGLQQARALLDKFKEKNT